MLGQNPDGTITDTAEGMITLPFGNTGMNYRGTLPALQAFGIPRAQALKLHKSATVITTQWATAIINQKRLLESTLTGVGSGQARSDDQPNAALDQPRSTEAHRSSGTPPATASGHEPRTGGAFPHQREPRPPTAVSNRAHTRPVPSPRHRSARPSPPRPGHAIGHDIRPAPPNAHTRGARRTAGQSASSSLAPRQEVVPTAIRPPARPPERPPVTTPYRPARHPSAQTRNTPLSRPPARPPDHCYSR